MLILQETNNNQTIKVIPREYFTTTTYAVNITSDSENKNVYSQNFTNQFTLDRYWFYFSSAFPNLEEDNFYTLRITSPTREVFRGRIFCTNQTISSYSVNSGEYTTTSSINEFTFYEA
mgnify:CR=1 FL=1|tara:strand:+ start:122 stop:475 length:354 start_codon:yes stop_codon:yes gene_type:complete